MRILKIFLVLFFLIPNAASAQDIDHQVCTLSTHLEIAGTGVRHAFEVELALTPQQQSAGLMYRKEMADDHGMLFFYIFPQHVSFWMKNTYIPLDLIFIREDGIIVNIHREAKPFSLKSIKSGEEVTGVLELNGGLADELGPAEGDIVHHEFFNNVGESDDCS